MAQLRASLMQAVQSCTVQDKWAEWRPDISISGHSKQLMALDLLGPTALNNFSLYSDLSLAPWITTVACHKPSARNQPVPIMRRAGEANPSSRDEPK